MLFSSDITTDYIILDDNVLKIVNKYTEIGKKKIKKKITTLPQSMYVLATTGIQEKHIFIKQNKSTTVTPGTQAHQCCPFSSAWGIFMKLYLFNEK